MIKQDFYIANIIARHLSGEITHEESVQLESWRKEDSAHEALFQKICSKENLKKHVEKGVSFDVATGWLEVQKRIRKSNNRERMMKILRYAAAVLIPVFFVGITLKYTDHDHSSDKSVLIAQPILPGAAKAILTLDNGETINLNKETADALRKIEGTHIQVDSTTLNYRLAQSTSARPKPVYNKVEIPRGGEYALVLSDGTKVHLNSMSSLRFPVAFTTGKREVELQGEAYFEVESDKKHPFIVKTKELTVEATGTAFNVNAYTSDNVTAVTLVKGKVAVTLDKKKTISLSPGEKIDYNLATSLYNVNKTNTYKWCSWKDGILIFRDDPLEYVFKRLGQTYNVEFILKDAELGKYSYKATFEGESLNEILRLLEMSAPIRCKEVSNRNTNNEKFEKQRIEVSRTMQ